MSQINYVSRKLGQGGEHLSSFIKDIGKYTYDFAHKQKVWMQMKAKAKI